MDVVLAFIILLACNLAKTIVHPKMKTTNLLMTWNILHKMDHIYNIFLEYFSPFIKLEIIYEKWQSSKCSRFVFHGRKSVI